MTRSGFWKTDWFVGVAGVISVVLFNLLSDLVPSLERKGHDLGVVATLRAPSDIIYAPEGDAPKVTVFGIARITEFAAALCVAFNAGAWQSGGHCNLGMDLSL